MTYLDKYAHAMYNIGMLMNLLQETVVKSSDIDGIYDDIYNPEKES